jgi:hypothetical protein
MGGRPEIVRFRQILYRTLDVELRPETTIRMPGVPVVIDYDDR